MAFTEHRVTLKSPAQIERMARAGRLVADVLDRMAEAIRPGVSTLSLDVIARELIEAAGATPSFIGVPGIKAPYRHATCVSIDDEVVHGIPSAGRIVREGSLVSVDVGAIVEGWHGDAARTFIVGTVPEPVQTLVRATREAMLAGIAAARAGNHIGDISAAVEDVAIANGLGVVRPFVGHGIGTDMHEAPQVPNYRLASRGRRLEPGLCLAIEPMFTLGEHHVRVDDDGWTVRTVDRGLAAHFEHTIAVTTAGPRILTTNEPATAGLPLAAAT
jgi:methionyl aminopeptidase